MKNLLMQSRDNKDAGIRRVINPMRNGKGMTLLEIAISLAIMSIALVALANLFPIGLKASRRASDFSEAGILAQRVIENIKIAASIDDVNDFIDKSVLPYNNTNRTNIILANQDGIGYFELVNQDPDAFPFYDDDAPLDPVTGTRYLITDADGYSTYLFKYDDTEMDVYVKSVDWDANDNGDTGLEYGDLEDVLLSQKVYVAVYWVEADQDRAETFITYISNPFYEKYR